MKRFIFLVFLFFLFYAFVPHDTFAQKNSMIDLYNQSVQLYLSGDYSAALRIGQEALRVATEQYGETHMYRTKVINHLAMVYKKQGNYSQAEKLYMEALTIQKNIYGANNLEVAQTLNNLGVLYRELGRFDKAEKYYLQSLEIKEKNLPPDSQELANIYQNLGAFYSITGNTEKAQPYIQRALKIREKSIAMNDGDEIASLNSLALLYQSQGKHAEAESLLVLALNKCKSLKGENHPDVAQPLNNLAAFYQSHQKYNEAKLYLNQALQLIENNLGPDHPQVGSVLNNMALLEIARRRPEAYIPLLKRKFSIEAKVMRTVFSSASEVDRLAFAGTFMYGFDLLQSAVVQESPQEDRVIKIGLDTTLQRKGLVLDSLTDERRALMNSDNKELVEIATKLNEVSSNLATLTLSGPGNKPADEYKRTLEKLEEDRENLEAKIAELSSSFAAKKKIEQVDSEQISEFLHGQSALVEFVKFIFYDFQNKMEPSPRYIAYVLVPQKKGSPILVDLGNGDTIDGAIYDYRNEISQATEIIERDGEKEAERRLQEKGKKLYELIIQPLSPYIFTQRELFLCTDGNMSLIPFSVFSDENNKYLIEKYQINYLSSSRDLLRFERKTASSGEVVVLAGPDYDVSTGQNESSSEGNKAPTMLATRSTAKRSLNLNNVHWTELPGTVSEAEIISSKLEDMKVTTYVGEYATEKAVKSLQSPSILHIATHGFFLEDQNYTDAMDTADNRGIKKVTNTPTEPDDKKESSDTERGTDSQLENPLLRSGLVFAGANNLGENTFLVGDDDGILTALEISGLRLWDTDIVVLSACETGLGEVQKGEGVFGLRRAFQLAGVKTIIMSMWEVPDKETIDFMSTFYDQIKLKTGKSNALHYATLNALYKRRELNGAAHPFFWGAFVIIGEP